MKQQILNSSRQHGLVPPFSTARSHATDSRSRTRATPAPVKGMSCTRGPLIGSQLDKEEVWPVRQSSESQTTPTLESRPTSVDAESPEGRTLVPRQKHKWRPRSTVVSITRSVQTDRALDSPSRSSTLTPSQTTPLTSTPLLSSSRPSAVSPLVKAGAHQRQNHDPLHHRSDSIGGRVKGTNTSNDPLHHRSDSIGGRVKGTNTSNHPLHHRSDSIGGRVKGTNTSNDLRERQSQDWTSAWLDLGKGSGGVEGGGGGVGGGGGGVEGEGGEGTKGGRPTSRRKNTSAQVSFSLPSSPHVCGDYLECGAGPWTSLSARRRRRGDRGSRHKSIPRQRQRPFYYSSDSSESAAPPSPPPSPPVSRHAKLPSSRRSLSFRRQRPVTRMSPTFLDDHHLLPSGKKLDSSHRQIGGKTIPRAPVATSTPIQPKDRHHYTERPDVAQWDTSTETVLSSPFRHSVRGGEVWRLGRQKHTQNYGANARVGHSYHHSDVGGSGNHAVLKRGTGKGYIHMDQPIRGEYYSWTSPDPKYLSRTSEHERDRNAPRWVGRPYMACSAQRTCTVEPL